MVRPPQLEPSIPVEEERVRGYRATDYYPVNIGNVFRERYCVVGKLGYGSASTVWLCRDLKEDRDRDFVTLKLYIDRSRCIANCPSTNTSTGLAVNAARSSSP